MENRRAEDVPFELNMANVRRFIFNPSLSLLSPLFVLLLFHKRKKAFVFDGDLLCVARFAAIMIVRASRASVKAKTQTVLKELTFLKLKIVNGIHLARWDFHIKSIYLFIYFWSFFFSQKVQHTCCKTCNKICYEPCQECVESRLKKSFSLSLFFFFGGEIEFQWEFGSLISLEMGILFSFVVVVVLLIQV